MAVYRTRATLLVPTTAAGVTVSTKGTRERPEPLAIPIRASRRYRGGREEESEGGLVARWDAFYESVRIREYRIPDPDREGETLPLTLGDVSNVTGWRLRDEDLPGRPVLHVVAVEFPEAAGNTLMRVFVTGFARGGGAR